VVVSAFRRYLLISNREERQTGENAQLDVASWDALANIANPADYDTWVLNVSMLKEQQPPRLFTDAELRVLFHQSNFGPVLLGGGRIYIIGDLTSAFFTPPSTGSGAGSSAIRTTPQPVTRNPYIPFAELLGISRDSRPIDYRRISRSHEYHYERFYAFLDQVVRWDYSLRIKAKDQPIGEIHKLGETNFGTCAAASFAIGPGWINVLPSLGTTSEADENYILQHFLQFRTDSPPPAWSQEIVVPEQAEIEARRDEALARARDLIEEAKRQKENLVRAERWKRLLFDGDFGLEEIVGEAFTTLGATLTKPTKERADFRITVPLHGTCVVEVKGTRSDQFSRRDLRQLSEWIDEAMSDELATVKGVFVGNAAREKHPSTRGAMFDTNNLNYAKLKQMVVITSVDLYCLAVLELTGKLDKKQFWKEFTECSGEFEATKYRDALPAEFALNRADKPKTASG